MTKRLQRNPCQTRATGPNHSVYHPRPERWPQVSLKGFFLLVTLLGVFFGWLAVQVKWIRDRREALQLNESHRSSLLHSEIKDIVAPYPALHPILAPWSIRILGEAGRELILVVGSEIDQERFSRLKRLFPEAEVRSGSRGRPPSTDHPNP